MDCHTQPTTVTSETSIGFELSNRVSDSKFNVHKYDLSGARDSCHVTV